MNLTDEEKTKIIQDNFAPKKYDDSFTRDATIKILRKNKNLAQMIKNNYCDGEETLSLIEDPYGEKDVDFGIINKNKELVCLLEVETYESWKTIDNVTRFPKHYKYFTFLERKKKYIRKDLNYIHFIFSNDHSGMLFADKTTIVQYPPKTITIRKNNVNFNDKIRQIPITISSFFSIHDDYKIVSDKNVSKDGVFYVFNSGLVPIIGSHYW